MVSQYLWPTLFYIEFTYKHSQHLIRMLFSSCTKVIITEYILKEIYSKHLVE